jgi:hypothetical protein
VPVGEDVGVAVGFAVAPADVGAVGAGVGQLQVVGVVVD